MWGRKAAVLFQNDQKYFGEGVAYLKFIAGQFIGAGRKGVVKCLKKMFITRSRDDISRDFYESGAFFHKGTDIADIKNTARGAAYDRWIKHKRTVQAREGTRPIKE